MKKTFNIVIFIARPAAGKSELIQYLKNTKKEERERRFHIGNFEEIDDFPMLWTWFEEDKILSAMGKPRLYTTPDGFFRYTYLWDLLIRRMCLEYEKRTKGNPHYHDEFTTIIEFSRGSEHGGYARAFEQMSEEILTQSAVLYIKVSYEESLRKNRGRFNPDKPYSILEHSLPDNRMETLYRESDWETLSSADSEYFHIRGIKIPYAELDNEDDVTTTQGEVLGSRLAAVLENLWVLYKLS